MAKRSDGCLAGRQAMLREQFGNGAIGRLPLSQFSDDIFSREQVLELLRTERSKFRDRLADCGWVKRGHRRE